MNPLDPRLKRNQRRRRGVGATDENDGGPKVPLWAAMVGLVGAALYFGSTKR
jgi:hypothetical protein